MEPLAVGAIGAGTIARWHAATLESLRSLSSAESDDSPAGNPGTPPATLRAVADPDSTARESFADAFGLPEDATYDSHRRMLEAESLDVVVVAVPNAYHAECAIDALEAGCTVLVEKPLAASLEDAERIVEAERTSPGTVAVGFMHPFGPAPEAAAERISSGDLGDVYEVDLTTVRRRGIPKIGSWFTREAVAGGGTIIDAGVHVLHLGLHLLEFPSIETVSATTGAHFGTKSDYTYRHMWGGGPTDDAAFTVEDTARALVRTADGTTVHLECAWAKNRPSDHGVYVAGDEAGLEFDVGDDSLTTYGVRDGRLTDETDYFHPMPASPDLDIPYAGRFTAEWTYLLEVAGGEREHVRSTVEEGLIVQRVIDAIYESANQGREVTLSR